MTCALTEDCLTHPLIIADAKREKRANKRRNIVAEILQTEQEYIQDLLLCREGYLESDIGVRSSQAPPDLDSKVVR